MSALHAVLLQDRVMILADGAAYDLQTGAIVSFERKIFAHPTLPIAIGCVGLLDLLSACRSILDDPGCNGSLDDILQAFRGILLAGRLAHRQNPGSVAYGEVLIAGISGNGQPRMAVAHIGEVDPAHNPPGREAFALQEIEVTSAGVAEFCRSPMLSSDLQTELQTLMTENGHLGYEMFRLKGAEYFDIMRRAKCSADIYGGATEFHGVGGHLDYCEVTAAGVSIETIHTWPDTIGKPIKLTGRQAHARG